MKADSDRQQQLPPSPYLNGVNSLRVMNGEYYNEDGSNLKGSGLDFENFEESLRNMLRHNGSSIGDVKDDTARQMHAYKNAISKFHSHISMVERENHALKRQITNIASQTVTGEVPNGDMPQMPRHNSHGVTTEKAQLEDIRATCLMLSDRIKRMEEQNNLLLVNAEKQRSDYERCLGKVASQVFQALSCQRRLQVECDALRMQVYNLTGTQPYPVQSPILSRSEDSPQTGNSSAGSSVSEDPFSPTAQGNNNFSYRQWQATPATYAQGGSPQAMYPPMVPGQVAGQQYNSSDAQYVPNINPRMQYLDSMLQASPTGYMNGYPTSPMSPRDYPPESQFERYPMSQYRLQPTRSPPLHVIPESIEPPTQQRNTGGFRPRLIRSGSEIITRKPYVEMTSSRITLDDESVGRVSRSRDRQRSSNDRNKIARSRSFDEHSTYVRNDVTRPQQGISPLRYAQQRPPSYRPAPALNSPPATMEDNVPMTSSQNMHHMASSSSKFAQPHNLFRKNPNSKTTNCNARACDIEEDRNRKSERIFQSDQIGTCLLQNISNQVSQQPASNSANRVQDNQVCFLGTRNPADQEFTSSFQRGALQRSFRVTRSCERRHERGVASDDVWLPRSDGQREPIPLRLPQRKKSLSQIEDLPPPPPPPPTDEQYLEIDTEQSSHNKEMSIKPQEEVFKQNDQASPPSKEEPHVTKQGMGDAVGEKAMEDSIARKFPLAKRESYTAACRISQSLDHISNIETGENSEKSKNHGRSDFCEKSMEDQKHCSEQSMVQKLSIDEAYVSPMRAEESQGKKSSQKQKSPSQLQAPKSRLQKKSTKREAPKPPSTKSNHIPNQRDGNTQQSLLAPASSCETLTSSNTSSHDVSRRMSEGMVRGLSRKSRLATPSSKRNIPETDANVTPPRKHYYTDANETQHDEVTPPPLPPKNNVPPCGEIETSIVGNLPGNRSPLSSSSCHNIANKTQEKPLPELALSQPNLSKLTKDEADFKCTKVLSETNLLPKNNEKAEITRSRHENVSPRSHSEEPRSKLNKSAIQSKLIKRSQSSDRTTKKSSNHSTKKDEPNSKNEKKNEGKKKPSSQKTFVNIMKSKFGGKSSNSTNKKTTPTEKSETEVKAPLSVTTAIDPRTLSLEPNSIPPPKNATTQDMVGRKLSQPFLNPNPNYAPGTGVTKTDIGQKKSFLSRHNSKRNKGLRHGAFDNGDHYNNHPFGRVELIPVGIHPMAASNTDYGNLNTPIQTTPRSYQTNDVTQHVSYDSKFAVANSPKDCVSPNVTRRQNDYENVVLLNNNYEHERSDVTDPVTSHNYENVVIVNAHKNEMSLEKSNLSVQTKLPKQASSLKKIWSSLSNHSLNKLADTESGSRTALHQIGGGRGVSGEGSSGNKANVYAEEQRMFEKVFISSVVEAELQQKEKIHEHENRDMEFCVKNQNEYCKSIPENRSAEGTQNTSAHDYLSQTESGKSSMTFSTTSSSKSGHSSFDSWPSKYIDRSPKVEARRGGSLDACFRDVKSIDEIETACGRSYLQSRRHVGNSHSSLGSFGYGSGVSSSSTSSSNKSSLRRGCSPLSKSPNNADEDPILCSPQDSSSDNDLTPSQKPSSLEPRYAARKFSNPIGSKLAPPQRITRLKTGASPGRVKMGVSSISPESYSPELVSEQKPKKLAPLNYGFVSPPSQKASNPSQIPTKPFAIARAKETRKSSVPCRSAAGVPVPSKISPQGTGIPKAYQSSRQQQHAR